MTFEKIQTDKAPIPLAKYAQGSIAGAILCTAGQIAINPKTGKLVEGGIEEQTNQAISNIEAIMKKGHERLEELGICDSIVRSFQKVFFTNPEHLRTLKENCESKLEPRFQYKMVSGLPLNALVEVCSEERRLKFFKPKDYHTIESVYSSDVFDASIKTDKVIKNVDSELKRTGSNLKRVFHVETTLKDLRNYGAFNSTYALRFQEPYPTRAVVEDRDMPSDSDIRMVCQVYLGKLDA